MDGHRVGADRVRGSASPGAQSLDHVAREYVRLVLATGRHDPDYVDAFYGPAEWKREAEDGAPVPLDVLLDGAREARAVLANSITPDTDGERASYLAGQLAALCAHLERLAGVARRSFDEESAVLYQARAPHFEPAYFAARLDALGALLPGDGPVPERYQVFRERFVVPPDRVDAVFRAAIEEARRRTAVHVELPTGERFEIEYVGGKPWSGYNWFKGDACSLIQVNTDLPIFIDRALDLAAHEGYPGHHVYNALLEHHVVGERGWFEASVYPLFSPQSLIAEGTANFGIDVAFPGPERLAFERDVLFPLAGLDPGAAADYTAARSLAKALAYAGNEAARDYLDGRIGRDEAAAFLVEYALMSPAQAAQRVRFFEAYRSYVINYNLGEDLVRAWVERHGGTADAPERRWEIFAGLLRSLVLPAALVEVS